MFSFVAPKKKKHITQPYILVFVCLKFAEFPVCYTACVHSQPAAADPGLRPGAPDPAAAENPGALAGTGCSRGSYHLNSNSEPFTYQHKQFARISVVSFKPLRFYLFVIQKVLSYFGITFTCHWLYWSKSIDFRSCFYSNLVHPDFGTPVAVRDAPKC